MTNIETDNRIILW